MTSLRPGGWKALAWILPAYLGCIAMFWGRQIGEYPFWTDPAREILVPIRVAQGQLPGSDFTWPYPPLTPLLNGALVRFCSWPPATVIRLACAANFVLLAVFLDRLASRWLGFLTRALLHAWLLTTPFIPLGYQGSLLSPYAISYAYGVTLTLATALLLMALLEGRRGPVPILLGWSVAALIHLRADFYPVALASLGVVLMHPAGRRALPPFLPAFVMGAISLPALLAWRGVPATQILEAYLPMAQLRNATEQPLWTLAVDYRRSVTVLYSALALGAAFLWSCASLRHERLLRLASLILLGTLFWKSGWDLPARVIHGQWGMAWIGLSAIAFLTPCALPMRILALLGLACWGRTCWQLAGFPLTWPQQAPNPLLYIGAFLFWGTLLPDWIAARIRVPFDAVRFRILAVAVLLIGVCQGGLQAIQDACHPVLQVSSRFGAFRTRDDPKGRLWIACLEACAVRMADGSSVLAIPSDDLPMALGVLPSHPFDQMPTSAGDGIRLAALLASDPSIRTVVIVRLPWEYNRFGSEFGQAAAELLKARWEVYRILGGCPDVPWWELTRALQRERKDAATVYFLRRKSSP